VRSVLLCLCTALIFCACGKKGNPLPPLVRVPAAPGDFAVSRFDDQVFVRLSAPATNIDGLRPADVARVEVYAITHQGAVDELSGIDAETLREASTLVATEQVRRPLPPPPPVKEGMPPIPVPPPEPGVEQGAPIVVREVLTPEARTPATLPDSPAASPVVEAIDVPRALVAPPPGAGLQRFYFAVAVSPRNRYGPHTAIVPAPLGATSGPPSAPRITVNETSMALQWTPPVDARGLGLAGDPEWLTARPIVPGPLPTTYDVYEVPRNATPDAPIAVPTPLTSEPVAATEFAQSDISLGTERCFAIRAVDIIDGVHVRGPASPTACAAFADTFVPSAPRDLVAVAVPGGVNLIWEPSEAKDVAGYVVLRGQAGSDTLTPLIETPLTTPSYRDEAVTAGVRYVYAVVAVDRAGNRSAESNRVEETAQ
jgi:hypothetical protein